MTGSYGYSFLEAEFTNRSREGLGYVASGVASVIAGALASTTPAAANPISQSFKPPTPSLFPYYRSVRGSSIAAGDEEFHLLDALRRADFVSVSKVVSLMMSVSSDDDFYLETEVGEHGFDALSLIYMTGLPVPKVFSHDSDSLTFSWDRGEISIYVTVGDGAMSLIYSDSSGSNIIMTEDLESHSSYKFFSELGAYVGAERTLSG